MTSNFNNRKAIVDHKDENIEQEVITSSNLSQSSTSTPSRGNGTNSSPEGKSPVWQFFNKVEDLNDKKTYSYCTVDNCVVRLVFLNNTTTMLRHLKSFHPDAHQTCLSKMEKSVSTTQPKILAPQFKLQPLSKEKSQLISRRTITDSVLPKLYLSMKSELEKQLKEIEYCGLSWTSLAIKSFLMVTVHFSSPDFTMQNYVLKTVEVKDSHTGTHTASVVTSILKEFGLLENLQVKFVATSDLAPNMVATAKELKFPHIACLAHVLHNSLKHSFSAPELKKIFKKVDDLIIYFRSSPQRSSKLLEKQKSLGLPEVKLKVAVETRWSSQYQSIDRLLKAHQVIINIGLEDNEVKSMTLSLDEWQDLAKIRDALKPFHDIIEILQTSQTPSISMIHPLFATIQNNILKINQNDGDYVTTIKHLIMEDFVERTKCYNEIEDLLLLSTVIDPRFKNLNFLEINKKNRALKLLKEYFQDYKERYEKLMTPEREEMFEVRSLKQVKLNEEALVGIFQHIITLSNEDTNKNTEVDLYLATNQIPILDDPLYWWKQNSSSFKILSRIAKDFLPLPATSAASERIFSKSGHIVSKKRSMLASKNVNVLVFLAENYKTSPN